MGRFAIGHPNHAAGATIVQASLSRPEMPASEILSPVPGKAFGSSYGSGSVQGMSLGGSAFDVDSSNDQVDWTDGVTTWNATIPTGAWTKKQLGDLIAAAMNAAEGISTITFSPSASGKFAFVFPSNRTLLLATGANASSSVWEEIGFDVSSDTSSTKIHVADERRDSTHVFVALDLGSAKSVDIVTAILGGDDDCDFSDVMVFGGDIGIPSGLTRNRVRNVFNTYFPTEISLSDRATSDDNLLQGAVTGETKTHRYWVFSWRDVGTAQDRFVGHIGLWPALRSSFANIRSLRGHDLVDPSEPMGVERAYSQDLPKRWALPVAIEQWTVADWRSVFVAATRQGMKTDPGVVLLDFDTIRSGSDDFEDCVENGRAIYATMPEKNEPATVGALDAYVDASYRFEQFR